MTNVTITTEQFEKYFREHKNSLYLLAENYSSEHSHYLSTTTKGSI